MAFRIRVTSAMPPSITRAGALRHRKSSTPDARRLPGLPGARIILDDLLDAANPEGYTMYDLPWYDAVIPLRRSHDPPHAARLHADRVARRHRDYCHLDRAAPARRPEGPRGRGT